MSETPVLDVLAAMTAASLASSELPVHDLLMIRIAALASVDAGPASYLAHVGPSLESGVTLVDVQSVLVAVAPIIGTARTMKAAGAIAEALGFAIAIVESAVE